MAFFRKGDPRIEIRDRLLDARCTDLARMPALEWGEILEKDFGASRGDANRIIQHIIWNQIVDFDLSGEVTFARAPRSGGRAYREKVRAYLAGKP
jgi:hypothetical protein